MKQDIDLSEEQIQQMQAALSKAMEVVAQLAEVIREAVDIMIDAVRQIAEGLARFFVKLLLLEWRLPYPLAEWVAQKVPGWWAMKFGFGWFERKMQLKN